MSNDNIIDLCLDESSELARQINRQKHSRDIIDCCSDDDKYVNLVHQVDAEQVLKLDDVSTKSNVKLKRLKRRETSKNNDYRTLDFAFNKDDNEDIYTYTSESSYSGDEDDNTRRAQSLNDHRLALYNAFKHLQNSDYNRFLTSEVIRHEFRSVNTVIESCGKGDGVHDTLYLWFLAWKNELNIMRLDRAERKQICISCGLSRDLVYVVFQIDKYRCNKLGHMGRGCYNRFCTLTNLVNVCKSIAITLSITEWNNISPEFDEFVIDELQKAIDIVNSAPEQMKSFKWFKHD